VTVLRRKVELSPGQQEQWQQELTRLEQQWQEPSLMEVRTCLPPICPPSCSNLQPPEQ
jgi:hypothetical protein